MVNPNRLWPISSREIASDMALNEYCVFILYRTLDVIDGCKTLQQLNVAEAYANLAIGALKTEDENWNLKTVRIITNTLMRRHKELKK